MSDDEERVAVSLGDDYYTGAYFLTRDVDSSVAADYLVPRSQLERWEAAKAAYEEMQSEVDKVMREQRERIRAINAKRPKSQVSRFVQDIYEPLIRQALERPVRLDGLVPKEGE